MMDEAQDRDGDSKSIDETLSQITWEPTPSPPPPLEEQMRQAAARDQAMLQRTTLKAVAQETVDLLPGILQTTPHVSTKAYRYDKLVLPKLHPRYSPGFQSVEVKVVNEDSYDAAIGLAGCSRYMTSRDRKPVCVLNMANAYRAGGGFVNGALAQEEALCYRSSLYFTLKRRYYPLGEYGSIYSPFVLIIRGNLKDGHQLLELSTPDQLPVVSVVSVAALSSPETKRVQINPMTPGSEEDSFREVYANSRDRLIMKEKMRVILRTAAFNGCRRIVLGAFGCGAFHNPKEEVADCWAEVLQENEFKEGWWESIVFAVLDSTGEGTQGDGNFGVFFRRLHGLVV